MDHMTAIRVQCQGLVKSGTAMKQCPNLATERRRSWRYGKYDKVIKTKPVETYWVRLCPVHGNEWDLKKEGKAREEAAV